MKSSESTQSTSTGTFYLMVAEALALVSNYGIHIILARLLGPSVYGIFGILLSLYLLTGAFLNTGFAVAVSKHMAEEQVDKAILFRKSMYLQLSMAVFFALLFVFFSSDIARILKDHSLTPYLIILGIMIIPLAVFSLFLSGYLNGLKRFAEQAVLKIIYTSTRGIFALILVFLGWKIMGVLVGYLIATLLAMVLSILVFLKLAKKENIFSHQSHKKEITGSQLYAFAIPLTISALLFSAIKNINVLFLKTLLLDNSQVGIYTAAVALANAPALILSAVPMALLPSVSKSFSQGNMLLTRAYIQKSIRYCLLLVAPVLAIVAGSSLSLVTFFYSEKYSLAAPLLVFLFGASLFQIIFSLQTRIITGSGKPKVEMYSLGIFITIMMILNFLLVPRFGLAGMAWATFVSSLISTAWISFYTYQKFKIVPFEIRSLVKIILSGISVFAVAQLWQVSGWFLLIEYVILGLLYILLLYLFGELKQEDLQLVRKVFKSPKLF